MELKSGIIQQGVDFRWVSDGRRGKVRPIRHRRPPSTAILGVKSGRPRRCRGFLTRLWTLDGWPWRGVWTLDGSGPPDALASRMPVLGPRSDCCLSARYARPRRECADHGRWAADWGTAASLPRCRGCGGGDESARVISASQCDCRRAKSSSASRRRGARFQCSGQHNATRCDSESSTFCGHTMQIFNVTENE